MDTSVVSIGHVAGAIAAGVFVVQLFLPTALASILTGVIREDNTLVTWSVVGRVLHGSYWPILCRSDSAATRGVAKSVTAIVWLRPILRAVVAIAAVVTPPGLYEQVIEDAQPHPEPFRFAIDNTPMGYGTPSMSSLGLNRRCYSREIGSELLTPCPGSPQNPNNGTFIFVNETEYDYTIPETLYNTFTSGLGEYDESVSSVFNIQWRSFSEYEVDEDGRDFIAVGQFRPLVSIVLDDEVKVVQGLIVDTVNGGIGFRNHSVPPPTDHGSTWFEDVLFVEPETQCVDLNLTIDFELCTTAISVPRIDEAVITDRGGFSNINQQDPIADLSNTSSVFDMDLRDRAYRGAWINNVYSMAFMNITNPDGLTYLTSTEGDEFHIAAGASTTFINTDVVRSVMDYGSFIKNIPGTWSNETVQEPTLNADNRTNYVNPHSVSTSDFDRAVEACKGSNRDQVIDGASVAVTCGMVFGAPRKQGDDSATLFIPGDRLSIPMYSCASASRAVIKRVGFSYNGTGELSGLTVISLANKEYENDKIPHWGIERTNLPAKSAAPLWGLVEVGRRDDENLVVRQQQSLRLPGFQDQDDFGQNPVGHNNMQNLAGADFHIAAMSVAYGIDSLSHVQDYSGRRGLSMFSRWQELSWNEAGVAKMLNLVWTDVAANAVHGSKGWLSRGVALGAKGSGDSLAPYGSPITSESVDRDVTTARTRIRYRWAYAIPAFIALLLTGVTAVAAVALLCLGRATPARMRWALNSTSCGRVYGTLLYPRQVTMYLPTRRWLDQVGPASFRVRSPKGLRQGQTHAVADGQEDNGSAVATDQLLANDAAKQPEQSERRVSER